MNTLGEVWLEPGEKIEAFRNQKMFRLVATKLKAESLIRDLTKTLQSIETKSIPLSLFGSKMPDEATIEELGRITNTHVNPSSTLRRVSHEFTFYLVLILTIVETAACYVDRTQVASR